MARRDHDLIETVHSLQPLDVHAKEPVEFRGQLDLALLGGAGAHTVALAQRAQALRRLVFVEHALGLLPDIQRLLAHAQEHRDVLCSYNVALAEAGVLRHAGDDLRHVMTQHMADGIDGFDQFHSKSPLAVIGVR